MIPLESYTGTGQDRRRYRGQKWRSWGGWCFAYCVWICTFIMQSLEHLKPYPYTYALVETYLGTYFNSAFFEAFLLWWDFVTYAYDRTPLNQSYTLTHRLNPHTYYLDLTAFLLLLPLLLLHFHSERILPSPRHPLYFRLSKFAAICNSPVWGGGRHPYIWTRNRMPNMAKTCFIKCYQRCCVVTDVNQCESDEVHPYGLDYCTYAACWKD